MRGHNIQVEVVGSKGRFLATLTRGWELQIEGKITRGQTHWPGDDLQAQPALFEDLRTAVRGDWREFPTKVQNAARVADLMFACYASALDRRVVSPDETFDDSIIARLENL